MRTRLWTAGTGLLVLSSVAVVGNLARRESHGPRPLSASTAPRLLRCEIRDQGDRIDAPGIAARVEASCSDGDACPSRPGAAAATESVPMPAAGTESATGTDVAAVSEQAAGILAVGAQDSPESTAATNATRAAIRAELPQISDEELDVWARTFQGVAPDVLRDVLRVRRQAGALPTPATSLVPLPGATPSDVPALTPVPIPLPVPTAVPLPVDRPQTAERVPHDRTAPPSPIAAPALRVPTFPRDLSLRDEQLDDGPCPEDEVAASLLHDLRNACTPGYKARRIVVAEGFDPLAGSRAGTPAPRLGDDAPAADRADLADRSRRSGVAIAAVRIDTSPGRLEPTGRGLDLAIEGAGWFRVRSGDRVRFTRHGGFVLDESGQIGHRRDGTWWRIDPVVVIPEDATDIAIGADGTVRVRRGGEDAPDAVGQIPVVRFRDAGALQPVGHDLFAATRESGPGSTAMGEIRSGCLERANVDVAETRHKLMEWRELQSATIRRSDASRATPVLHGTWSDR